MLLQVIAIARDAAKLLAPGPAGPARAKSDGSPVTEADIAANQLIVDGLRALAPSIPLLSEESPLAPPATRAAWQIYWLVDPLDGTKEFLAGRDDFTVNIALLEGGVPILGVVLAPRTDTLYYGTRDGGSWKQVARNLPERLSSRPPAAGSPVTIVESRSHPSPEVERLLAGFSVQRRIQLGSSLKFCLVAEGSADLYPRFGPTMEWDVAAGDAVFRYSGEHGPRRSPLTYNKPDLRNGPFLIGSE